MSRAFRESANQREFIRLVDTELRPRFARFGSLQRSSPEVFRREWVEPDLIPIIDALSGLYAHALAEGRAGNAAAAALAGQLQDVLYQRIATACEDAGWFKLLVIIPFDTDFDPIRHSAIDSAEFEDATQKVVDIKQAGRLDVATGAVIVHAHVIVGR